MPNRRSPAVPVSNAPLPKKWPAILFIDIETAPDVTWSWEVYKANAIAVKESWYILSYAAQWRGDGPSFVRGLDDFSGYKGGNSTEKKIVEEIWTLFDAADVVVAHNGAEFDVKKINARMIDHGLPPPAPFRVVDTKRDLKKVARFSSNRLNWIAKQLDLGSKTEEHHDWKMWRGCMEGDPKMWKRMKTYNRHDVVLLRDLYEELSPWLDQPSGALFLDDADGRPACVNPACRGRSLQKWGTYVARTRKYQRYRCPDCGAWARGTKSIGKVDVTPTNRRYS